MSLIVFTINYVFEVSIMVLDFIKSESRIHRERTRNKRKIERHSEQPLFKTL